jgi:hypothetical protein
MLEEVRVWEFLLGVEQWQLGVQLSVGGSISQEVKPKDEMATDSQNGDIIALSLLISGFPKTKIFSGMASHL